MAKIMQLCVPCAEDLKERYDLTLIPGRSQKLTCEYCGKRRYGSKYEVEPKAQPAKRKAQPEEKKA